LCWSFRWLAVTGVSVSTRCHCDMRGLVTAGRAVRLELAAGLDDQFQGVDAGVS
jgi:hypothetical protein